MNRTGTKCMAILSDIMFILSIQFEPLHEKTKNIGFPTRSDTNWPVQSLKQARGLKFLF